MIWRPKKWVRYSRILSSLQARWRDFYCIVERMGFPGSSAGNESACSAGDPNSIPGSWRSTGEGIGYPLQYSWASLVAQLVKKLAATQETWVQSLGWEDPVEKGKCLTPVFWPGESHGLYSPEESQRIEHDWATFTFIDISQQNECIRAFFLKYMWLIIYVDGMTYSESLAQ